MSEDLITKYQYELTEPPCAPGSGWYGVRVIFSDDISPVLPYLNAVLEETVYDHENKILIGRDNQQQFAFRINEIRVAGVDEVSQAPRVALDAVELVNQTWQKRETIKPSFKERKLPTAIDIYQHLPKTNCRQCGYTTCLVFALELRTGNCTLEHCSLLSESKYIGQREAIRKLFSID